ncbi:MAG: hypothetical protein ABI569_03680 [Casimicrobiaceae bacterium]
MHLVLTLPGLLAQDADRAARAPHLARLLSIAGPPAHEPEGSDAALAPFYGIEHAAGTDWPLAPVRIAAHGVDPGEAFWLAADPVTLVAGRDDVRLAGIVQDLDALDAATLIAMLNAHFATDGIAFVAARPDAWFVRAPAPVAIRTRPVATVAGRMLRELLPMGPDAGTWQRWQSEIQMLLHDHPVNAARENEGKAPANSVWLSEGGMLPSRASAASVATFAGSGIAAALAAHINRMAHAVPAALDAALASASDASTLVVTLPPPLDLTAVERDWAAPAWAALIQRTLNAVTLIAEGRNGALAWTTQRPGVWRRFALRFARDDIAPVLAAARADA